jgi:NDP-sugar pyrophosphorylase family protein
MGRRLRSEVSDWPKPMVVINQKPFLDILIEYFSAFGFRRFILCTGYKSEVIRNYYNGKDGPLEFIISDEKAPLGTSGSVKNAEKFVHSNLFLVANGDSFCSVDLADFYSFHLAKQGLMSMVVVESKDTADCGLVLLDDQNKIVGFEEKKQKQPCGYVNAGIYFFQKEILGFVPANTNYSLERDLFPKMASQDSYAFVTDQELIDIGTPKRLGLAKKFFSTYTYKKEDIYAT